MNKSTEKIDAFIEHALPWIILAILLLYTFAKFFEHPYLGFRSDSERGTVIAIYVKEDTEPALQLGDRLVQIGNVRWDDFKADLKKTILDDSHTGELVPLLVERNGQRMIVPWRYAGPNRAEVLDLLFNEGWLAFIFWWAGTLALLNLRPKDERWRLMIAFNYLTAIWLVAGSGVSASHTWYSALVLRMVIWLCVPVYLHLHLFFPKPFKIATSPIIRAGYIIAAGLAVAEWLQLLPRNLYLFGFLVAVGGSLLLLVAHAIFQSEAHRDLRLLLTAALLSLLPSITIALIGTFSTLPTSAGAGTVGLPFLPLAYFYAAYRRQLGNLEIRINRLISAYIFLILLGIAFLALVNLGNALFNSPETTISIGLIAAIFAAAFAIWGFPSFQSFIEYRLLGIRLAPNSLLEIYPTRITTSTSLSSLAQLLNKEILPSLLVRQFVFVKFDRDSATVLFATGVTEEQMHDKEIGDLVNVTGKYRPLAVMAANEPCPWVRLALRLQIEDELIGLWLFGRRDPDDVYSQAEISVLQSLANQTGIALSNILQTERLRDLYHANIDRHEEERLHLALELHDSILNQLAVLLMNLDGNCITPGFQESFDALTFRLREIVSNLRPPMLNYGLKLALEDLADNLMERSEEALSVAVDIQASGEHRYHPNIEQHLFRIVQEACENALRHARAKKIKISGKLDTREIDLKLEDDGIGFETGTGLELNSLLANKHFGLAGMFERATLIGAQIAIDSTPKAGTHIQIRWSAPGQA